VSDLNRLAAGSVVDVPALLKARLIRGRFDGLKVLGAGDLDRALTVRANAFSASAKDKIEKAGGKAELIAASKNEEREGEKA
jgi:large subunit ribosomal protein L15